MDFGQQNLKIVLILAFGFGFASLLGYITHRLKLSSLLGFLIAGYLIGPYSPGFVADLKTAEQLAEIGVILMMFGVGVHFSLGDLIKVKNIAIPGAIIQTLITAVITTFCIYFMGWPLLTGLIIGLSIGVASTVVLMRVLIENQILNTPQGHIAVGWLIVEDLFTVAALIMLPVFAEISSHGGLTVSKIALILIDTIFKFLILIAFMFTLGRQVVAYILFKVAQARSSELFTLTILALTFCIATASALFFGTSLALGAFIAGMVIGQTHVRHQATTSTLPIQDAFIVLFFLSVGMLFNPVAIYEHLPLFFAILGIILLIKPLLAYLIVVAWRYPVKTALTVAIALAQIGEFSFILSEEAMKYDILPETGFDVVVAAAIVTISLNPILFAWIEKRPTLGEPTVAHTPSQEGPHALVIGFGPIGQKATETLETLGFRPIIIEHNLELVTRLIENNRWAIYGEAAQPHILESAQIDTAELMVITVPHIYSVSKIAKMARHLNPGLKIVARASYARDKEPLKELDVEVICCEEEAMQAFAQALQHVKH